MIQGRFIFPRALLLLVGLLGIASATPGLTDVAPTFAGKLLVATDSMRDPRFVETVIFIAKHDAHGAFGLVVNRPVARGPIADVLQAFDVKDTPSQRELIIHYGGPVQQSQAFVLHTDDVTLNHSQRLDNGLALTSDVELIKKIARDEGPKKSLFLLGYSGWGSGQLEREVAAGSWFTIPLDKQLIFSPDAANTWRRATDKRQIPL